MCILAIQRYKTNVDKEKQYKYKDTKPIRTYIKVSKPIQLLCVKTKTKIFSSEQDHIRDMMRKSNTMEPLLRGQPDERPLPLERPLDNINLNINVLISTPDERPPLLKGHFSGDKGEASQ